MARSSLVPSKVEGEGGFATDQEMIEALADTVTDTINLTDTELF